MISCSEFHGMTETSWKQTFDEHQVTSPAPKRSQGEWNLFLQCLKDDPISQEFFRTDLVGIRKCRSSGEWTSTDVWKELSILRCLTDGKALVYP